MQTKPTSSSLVDCFCLTEQLVPSISYTTFEVCTHALENGTIKTIAMGDTVDCLPVTIGDIEPESRYVLVLKDKTLISTWTNTESGFLSNPLNPIYSRTEVLRTDIIECYKVHRVGRYINKCRLFSGTMEKVKKDTRRPQLNDANMISGNVARAFSIKER